MKIPLLPVYGLSVKPEARSLRLLNGQGRRRVPRCSGYPSTVIAIRVHKRNETRIDDAHHLFRVVVPENRQPSDWAPVSQPSECPECSELPEANDLEKAPALFLGGSGVTHGEAAPAKNVPRIADVAELQGLLHFGISSRGFTHLVQLFVRHIRLDAFHLRPRDELFAVHINHGLERRRALTNYQKSLAPHRLSWLPGQHFFLRRLVKLNHGKARVGINFVGGLQHLVGRPDF
jgi:hypothetical protein